MPWAQELDREAVKQALVDMALDTDLRLDSAAFLDSLGMLHESSLLSTNSDISGLRVLDIAALHKLDKPDWLCFVD